jgi:hypothetical protein
MFSDNILLCLVYEPDLMATTHELKHALVSQRMRNCALFQNLTAEIFWIRVSIVFIIKENKTMLRMCW